MKYELVLTGKLKEYKDIFHPVSGKYGMLLSWIYYQILLWVHDLKTRV